MQEMNIPNAQTPVSLEQMVETILTSLDDDKGQDIMTFDLVGKSSIADRMIVASGTSARAVSAMGEHVARKLRDLGIHAKTEGERQGDWVLIDAGDVVIHLFRPEVRAFYGIERIWATPDVPAATDKPRKAAGKRA